jgi:hypothetical protein
VLWACRDIIYVTVLGRAWELGYHGRHSDQAKGWTFRVRILAGATDFCLLQIVQTAFGAHPTSISMSTTVLPGVKQLERDVDHAPPSSTEVKNKWNFTSAPCLRVYGMNREISTF